VVARLFNGTSDHIDVALDLSSYTTVSLSLWLWWDAFANNDKLAGEYTTNYNSNNAFLIDPNSSGGGIELGMHGPSGYWRDRYTRPSATAWHHWLIVFDRATPVITLYIDGVAQTATPIDHTGSAFGNFANSTFYLMSRAGTSLFAAGRLAEVALWGGVALGASHAASLAAASDPRNVSTGLILYLQMRLGQSPEPSQVGTATGIVTGTSLANDPPAILAPVGRPPGENWAA
jgi:hypothetical protein